MPFPSTPEKLIMEPLELDAQRHAFLIKELK